MKAMILAAGEGTRLRPLTLSMPKPLLPLDGIPVIERTMTWLKLHGISEVCINLCYLGEKIVDLIGDGSHLEMQVTYSQEVTALGTAGGVKKMEDFFDDSFVVVYGDSLTNFDLTGMMNFHREKNAAATLAMFEADSFEGVGVIETDDEGRILGFIEKPGTENSTCNDWSVNAGIYVLEKTVLKYVPPMGPWDFGYDVFPSLIRDGLPLYGYHMGPDAYFLDIGTLEKYEQANNDLQNMKQEVVG